MFIYGKELNSGSKVCLYFFTTVLGDISQMYEYHLNIKTNEKCEITKKMWLFGSYSS